MPTSRYLLRLLPPVYSQRMKKPAASKLAASASQKSGFPKFSLKASSPDRS